MIKRDELIQFIEDSFGREFGEYARRRDDYVNGVQILGGQTVTKVALGVSVNLEFLKRCRARRANFIIAHHGIALNRLGQHIDNVLKERLRILIDSDLTLLAYHYMLDAHPTFGNNAQILEILGAQQDGPFYDGWGFVGRLPKQQNLDTVINKLAKHTNSKPITFRHGPKTIKRIGVVSGGAAPHSDRAREISESAIELYITGEANEGVPQLAKETRINFAAFGHYNTETFGVKALGRLISQQYPAMPVEFIDIPNSL